MSLYSVVKSFFSLKVMFHFCTLPASPDGSLVAWDRPALLKPSGTETISFSNVKVFRLKAEGSIPLSLRYPDEDSSSTYKYATLTFKSEDGKDHTLE